MLTADLIRARVYRGEVRPRYIEPDHPDHLALAARLIEIFAAHQGRKRGELACELSDFLGTGTAFLLHRGLAKLLYDRSTFETAAPDDPAALRRRVFTAAAAAYRAPRESGTTGAGPSHAGTLHAGTRQAVLAGAAADLDLTPEEVERGLYADLKEEQVLAGFEPPQPGWLLDRYNVALAQAVLLRASELTIRLGHQSPRDLRALFRKVKFFQLLHRVTRDGDTGWLLHLDGPLSLFRSSQKYGLQMASFLPTLLHFDHWSLTASLLWGKRRQERSFRLSPATGLRPYGQLSGRWQPEELTAFAEAFARLDSGWEIDGDTDLVELGGQGLLVPDLVFQHRDSGTRVFMEVLGFWRRGAVESRLELLARRGPPNLILALSKRLAGGREEELARLPGEIYLFRSMPLAREVLKRLEAIRERGGGAA